MIPTNNDNANTRSNDGPQSIETSSDLAMEMYKKDSIKHLQRRVEVRFLGGTQLKQRGNMISTETPFYH